MLLTAALGVLGVASGALAARVVAEWQVVLQSVAASTAPSTPAPAPATKPAPSP